MDKSAKIEGILEQAVADGVATAATAWIWHDGALVCSVGTGRTRGKGGLEVHPGTVFDVASLTKPLTAALAARLLAAGLAEPVSPVLTASQVTLEQILSHRAGFQAWLPLHQQVDPPVRGTRSGACTVIEEAIRAERIHEPGERTVYSDLGYISLIPWLERTAGSTLDRALADHVTGPLQLTGMGYRAGSGPLTPPSAQIPATERVDHRGGVIQGEVHDDNAHAMGGVSSHAGLFASAPALGRFAVGVLLSREAGGWLPRPVARWFTSPVAKGQRTPGWDVKSPAGSSAGNLFGSNSFGHLGYTGCSLWVDPDARLVAVLLTNRVHPTSENLLIRAFRPRFHDEVFGLLTGPA